MQVGSPGPRPRSGGWYRARQRVASRAGLAGAQLLRRGRAIAGNRFRADSGRLYEQLGDPEQVLLEVFQLAHLGVEGVQLAAGAEDAPV